MTHTLTYAAITPARDEAANLPSLAGALAAQGTRPTVWIVVENGSTDGTTAVVQELVAEHEWVRGVEAPVDDAPLVRGGTVTRAFHLGLEALRDSVDVVVKLDADVTFEPSYFDRLLGAFELDPALGIASGTCLELERGVWVPRYGTGDSVWGAARAYRRECLSVVLPLEDRMGWDGIDQLKANMNGWHTRTLADLTFRHHRVEGERDGSRGRAWEAQGRASWYMGYRSWYLVARALHHARREPSALAMVGGYVRAAARREEQVGDVALRRYLRSQQRFRSLPGLMREAAGRGTR